MYRKYGVVGGDPQYRKQKWYEWWEQKGKSKFHLLANRPIPIRKPQRSSELAEFVGIVLGDGGITQYQLTITLHDRDERAYRKFVVSLIQKLFDVPIAQYHYPKDSIVDTVVSRSELIRFCEENLGLKRGNKVKQRVDIPKWIKKKRGYSIACVRGLIDTDGSVFTHRYKVHGKWYSYKKLSFVSLSPPLAQSVYTILHDFGLKPRLSGKNDVRLDSVESMRKYFSLVGSHNPKHLQRYRSVK